MSPLIIMPIKKINKLFNAVVITIAAFGAFVGIALAQQSAFDDPGSRAAQGSKGGDLVAVSPDIDACLLYTSPSPRDRG